MADAVEPSLVVDLLRARDLVALRLEAYECDLVSTESGPVIRPRASATRRLVIRFAYQHLAEQAIYEAPAPVPKESRPTDPPVPDPRSVDGDDARPSAPILARPARGSSLVFDVPAEEDIPFSTEGILAALSRLPLVVHPLAAPRPAADLGRLQGPTVLVRGPFLGTLTQAGLVLSRAPDETAIPDRQSAAGLSTLARELRRARTAMALHSGVVLETPAVETDSGPRQVRIGGVTHTAPGLVGPGGLAGVVGPGPGPTPGPQPDLSRPPAALETSLEAPFRLLISPSALAGWAHATKPVTAQGAQHRVELWHTRLGVRSDGGVDEKNTYQRVVRAVWARDREATPSWGTDAGGPAHGDVPFRSSLDGADRHMLVRQSAEAWLGSGGQPIPPVPVDARALWLSALGGWLDLHGEWDTEPYSLAGIPSILSWDHLAPQGRDQNVRVVYPGYLFPFGHRAALVKVTKRRMKDASPSIAGLYQRKFLVIGEPLKTYADRRLPFTDVRVAPLVTPTLDDPTGQPGDSQDQYFWPAAGGARFRFVLHCHDHEGRPVRLAAPLLWVSESFSDAASLNAVNEAYRNDPNSGIDAQGQNVTFAPVHTGGDTMVPAAELRFEGEKAGLRSQPFLRDAKVELPAVQALSPTGPVTITYAPIYIADGFGSTSADPNHPNAGDVWAQLPSPQTLGFGAGQPSGSDKAGGFLQPDLPIRGLSRLTGTVGDVAGAATKTFDPANFLAGALPKLFGLIPLLELLETITGDLGKVPSVVSEAVDRIEGFLSDVERAKAAVADAEADANRLVQRAPANSDLQTKATAIQSAVGQMRHDVDAAVDGLLSALGGLSGKTEDDVELQLAEPLATLRAAVARMEQVAPQLPPLVRESLAKLAKVLVGVLDAGDLVQDVFRFLNGLASSSVQAVFRFEWRPVIRPWPSPRPGAVLDVKGDPANTLVLAVEGRASGKGEMRVDVLAEIRDFALVLLPGEPLVEFNFGHLSFHAGTTGKPEIDVVLGDITFLGMLGFVETLKQLIPFDGFSDPPYLDVTTEGLSAGYSLALPNVAIGVFALSNMSLGADVQVPFLGKTVTVGFNFCTRERPFTLQVTFLGGGGWFLMRLSPDGLDVLELGLEAGATLSIDLGVASGSVSAMVGIYMRLEGSTGSLAGYLRIRGEVDVLGLVSASIELYLELTYHFDTGKMFGRATLTIHVEVLVFSGTVRMTCERQFAGAKGDPTFAQLMAVQPDGTSPLWSEYCAAFVGA